VKINERLFEKLRETGKTESELAEILKISTEQVRKWENSRSAAPKTEYLPVICEYLNVSLDWLVNGKEKETPNTAYNTNVNGGMVMQGTSNNGTIIITGVNGDKTITLSPEMMELIRIYDSLKVRDRINLMTEAYKLEDNKK